MSACRNGFILFPAERTRPGVRPPHPRSSSLFPPLPTDNFHPISALITTFSVFFFFFSLSPIFTMDYLARVIWFLFSFCRFLLCVSGLLWGCCCSFLPGPTTLIFVQQRRRNNGMMMKTEKIKREKKRKIYSSAPESVKAKAAGTNTSMCGGEEINKEFNNCLEISSWKNLLFFCVYM